MKIENNKIIFDNLLDISTGKLVEITGCGCAECVEKYQRIADMGRNAALRFSDMMSTEDHGSIDPTVDFSPH